MVFTHERRSPQHILMRNRVHSIYSSNIEYMTFSHERWNPQHLFLSDEVHSIYPMTDGVQGIYL